MRKENIMRSSIFILMVASVFFMACGSGSDQAATAEVTAPQKTSGGSDAEFTWYTDWDKGIEAAIKEQKPALVDFYADWCGYCKKMDKETFAASEIKSRLADGWIGIKINGEDKNKRATIEGKSVNYRELMQHFGIKGFPTMLIIDKEGNAVEPYTTDINYVPPKPFGPILDYFREELYNQDININDYIKSKI